MPETPYPSARWLRRLWSVNAVLLFAMLLIGLYSFLFPYGRGSGGEMTPLPVAGTPTAEPQPRAVRMSPPLQIAGTDTYLIEIRYGDAFGSYGINGDGGRVDPAVNIVFLDKDGGSSRALLDEPGVLFRRVTPGRRDSSRTWLAFEAVREDTDNDGLLGPGDLTEVLITDLNGDNPRRALDGPRRVTWIGPLGEDLGITYLKASSVSGTKPEELLERMAVYRVATGELEELATLSGTLEQVERILAR